MTGVGGALERAVMESLWAASEPLRVRELLTRLNQSADKQLAYNTVQTVADRLARKGLLRRIPDGNAFRYAPVRSREEHVVALMLDALTDTGDHGAILAQFAESMDVADAQQLYDALRRRSGKGQGR